jgi:hypothetical protein
MLLRFALKEPAKPALYFVYNELQIKQPKIAEVQIQPDGPHTIRPVRRLSKDERKGIEAFANLGL